MSAELLNITAMGRSQISPAISTDEETD
jgi:hypothetical protein